MRAAISLPVIVLMFFICSCGKDKLDGKEYIGYIENEKSPFTNSKEVDGLVFQLQYCPEEYMVLKQLKQYDVPQALIDRKKKEDAGLVFFKLRIKTAEGSDVLNYGISSQDDFYHRIDYLSYGFEENIAMVSGTDTIYPGIFQFERTYGISPNADFIMAFDAKLEKDKEFQVLIDDMVFSSGLLKFTYSETDIRNIPQLKTN